MYFCPDSDIHSVFVDGELPDEFKEEYLSHIASCPKCQKIVKRMQSIRASFIQDKNDITLSPEQIENSYKKLESMLDFKRITSGLDFSKFTPLINRLVPAVAAAVLIVMFLPVGLKKVFAPQYSSDYISQVWNTQNMISETSLSNLFNEQLSTSLVKSTEYLTNVNLENIISNNNESTNLYKPVQKIINTNSPDFSNVYNSEQNLYNVTYSPFVGF